MQSRWFDIPDLQDWEAKKKPHLAIVFGAAKMFARQEVHNEKGWGGSIEEVDLTGLV